MAVRGLYAIADATWNPFDSLAQLAETYLTGGARIVQLRMKRPDGADEGWEAGVYEAARGIAALKKSYPFTFIVNDYVDVACEVGADGVHVGANDMPVAQVKDRLRPGMIVGYSSHGIEEALAAEGAGADYVALGAIFPTPTKGPGHPVQGLDTLAELVARARVPVVAIGGVTRENVGRVIATGVSSVAMITALCRAPSIEAETRWFVDAFDR